MNWFVTIGGIAYNIVIILVCTAIILLQRKRKTDGKEKDFLYGGKQIGWFATAAGFALTALGGGHINGLTAQCWSTGVGTMFYCLGHGVFFIIIMRFTGVWYRRSGCATANEMYGKMFHPVLVPLVSGVCLGYSWLILCGETQGMGNIIATMTGIPNWAGCLIGAGIGLLYVLLAGMEEVGLVNSVNAILMYVFGIICLIFVGYNSVIGGWQPINDTLLAENEELLHLLGNGEILRTYIIGTFLTTCLGMNMIQANLQAAAAVPNVNTLRKACTAAIPLNVLFGVIMISLGLAAKGLSNMGMLTAVDGASGVVELVINYMPSWLQVCMIGVFMAAMLSTFAMLELTVATLLGHDILGFYPKFKKSYEARPNTINRIIIVVSGVLAALAAVMEKGAVNMAMTWGMAWFIPLFFIFTMGMYWKRSRWGAVATTIICWFFNMLLTFTELAAIFKLEGNNYSIFMIVLSIVLYAIFAAIDKKAAPPYKKVYKEQRARYDAARANAQNA